MCIRDRVNSKQQDALSRGQLAIAKLEDSYYLIPAPVAAKIAQRDTNTVISHAENTQLSTEEDPYADYQIPDDLMW